MASCHSLPPGASVLLVDFEGSREETVQGRVCSLGVCVSPLGVPLRDSSESSVLRGPSYGQVSRDRAFKISNIAGRFVRDSIDLDLVSHRL